MRIRLRFNETRLRNICSADGTLPAQKALDELAYYLLGPDWYDQSGATLPEDVNVAIVAAIEKKFPGAYVDREDHDIFREAGLVPFSEVPVGSICRVTSAITCIKIREFEEDESPKRKPNALSLTNGHHLHIHKEAWVRVYQNVLQEIEEWKK